LEANTSWEGRNADVKKGNGWMVENADVKKGNGWMVETSAGTNQ
jgi:hypothetical protein